MDRNLTTAELRELIEQSIRPSWRVGIVHADFYKDEMAALTKSAVDTLTSLGLSRDRILLQAAPGSFELPLIGAKLAASKQVDALIALGIIVEGQTHHARLIAEAAAQGCMQVQLQYQLPFAFEILYVNTLEHAQARLDKGSEAALAALHCLAQLHGL